MIRVLFYFCAPDKIRTLRVQYTFWTDPFAFAPNLTQKLFESCPTAKCNNTSSSRLRCCDFVRRTRFELVKAEPADLQSAPFDRFGTDAWVLLLVPATFVLGCE